MSLLYRGHVSLMHTPSSKVSPYNAYSCMFKHISKQWRTCVKPLHEHLWIRRSGWNIKFKTSVIRKLLFKSSPRSIVHWSQSIILFWWNISSHSRNIKKYIVHKTLTSLFPIGCIHATAHTYASSQSLYLGLAIFAQFCFPQHFLWIITPFRVISNTPSKLTGS